MNLEQLAADVFAKLESLAIKGFDLGQDMVMKEITYQTWLNHFLIWLGVVYVVLGIGYFILMGLFKICEWGGWDDTDDIIDHGPWFAGCFLFGILLIVGIILIPAALVELKHLEANPVYYVLKTML